MMNHATQRVVVSLLLLSAPMLALAQGAPARETPRPQDVDPGVNTSAPSQAPRDSRPEDIDPAVNTSAAAPANEDASASSSKPASAAGSGASSKTTASGAAKSATSKGGSTAAPDVTTAPNSPATSSTPNVTAPDAGTANPSSAKGAKPALGPDGKPVKGKALDRLELDTTQITGNRELPKVLYIVPWKRSDLGDLTGKPVNSLVDEVLTPVDRDVFKRENRYYRALENAPANATAPSSGTSPAGASDSGSANPAARDER